MRILQNPDKWQSLGLALDRKTVVERLDRIRMIRNDVMHYSPDGTGADELDILREFAGFLKKLMELQSV